MFDFELIRFYILFSKLSDVFELYLWHEQKTGYVVRINQAVSSKVKVTSDHISNTFFRNRNWYQETHYSRQN